MVLVSRFANLFFVTVASLSSSSFFVEGDISADSGIGKRLLSKAKFSNNNDGEHRQLENNYYTAWMSGYSLKFVGCHSIPQFEREEGLRTTMLAKFHLCKSDTCSRCSSNYGEYVVEMRDFIEAYTEAQQEANEYQCEYNSDECEYLCQNGLYYNNNDGNDDGNANNNNNNNNNGDNANYDADYCQSQCLYDRGYGYCNQENNQNNNMNMDEVGECRALNEGNENNNQYNYYNNWGQNGNDGSYQMAYVGAYCTNKGVYVATFTDQMCTKFAPAGTYEKYTGYSLPTEPLVTKDCISCGYGGDNQDGGNYYYNNNGGNNNNNNNNGGDNGYGVSESCERLYEDAGKCERGLKDVSYKNNDACELIDHTLKNLDNALNKGSVMRGKVSTFFAWTLFVVTMGMGGYIYFLHTRIIGTVNVKEAASGYFHSMT